MIELTVTNFRNLKSVSFKDTGKVSVIVGDNESGKSSIAGAIEFAFTGSAFDKKGQSVGELITVGEDTMKVSVKCGRFDVSRGTANGNTLKEIAANLSIPPATLPLLFNPKFSGQSDGRAWAAFTTLLEQTPLDLDELFYSDEDKELLKEVLSYSKTHAPKDVCASAEALRAKAQSPHPPSEPKFADPSNEAPVNYDNLIAIAQRIDEASATMALGERYLKYLEAVDLYEKKSKEFVQDSLGTRRLPLRNCVEIRTDGFTSILNTLEKAELLTCANAVKQAIAEIETAKKEAAEILDKNPSSPAIGTYPTISVETASFRDSLKNNTANDAKKKIKDLMIECSTLSYKLPDGMRTKKEVEAAKMRFAEKKAVWVEYRENLRIYSEQSKSNKSRWSQLNLMVKTIEDASDVRKQQIQDTVLSDITEYAAPILNGRTLEVSGDGSLALDGQKMDTLSESTKWRLLTSIMAAIAKRAGSPVLVLDGMDILDKRNQQIATSFVKNRLAPSFEHIVLLSTLKDPANAETPITIPGITKWIIHNGEIRATSGTPPVPENNEGLLAKKETNALSGRGGREGM